MATTSYGGVAAGPPRKAKYTTGMAEVRLIVNGQLQLQLLFTTEAQRTLRTASAGDELDRSHRRDQSSLFLKLRLPRSIPVGVPLAKNQSKREL